ncbi:11599_t:CDS:2 [Dentiscutata erythropus]|uniref:11599_t:CDS:1 n=1 Tax=Dentiscutata erythropus TaxID=1348616 RepID=A0A9N8WDK0_9GLOM|nr:11599_t:CDS:2 [Dentiscutata erythropus]
MSIDIACPHEWRKVCIIESLCTWHIRLNLKINLNTKKQYQVATKLTIFTRRFHWHNNMNDDIRSRKAANESSEKVLHLENF